MTAFLLPYDFEPNLKMLSDEEAGILLKAIFRYEIDKDLPDFDSRVMEICFNIIKNYLDANKEKYEALCRKRSESAKRRWQKDEKDSSECTCIQKDTPTGNTKSNTKSKSNSNSMSIFESISEADFNTDLSEENENTQTHKMPYGEFKNVFLSDEELTRLKEKVPDAMRRIESLSVYMKSSGKVYADHYAQLLNWRLFENSFCSAPKREDKSCKPPGERREPTFDVSEFTKKALDIRYVSPKDD